ncbi:hypothetical protein [Pedobacter sp. N23S346]|uniref:hypothetical protein n=1 Tax=Pedobacter sp. N23S346 TaxID=3402750 RepID=UPI003AF00865
MENVVWQMDDGDKKVKTERPKQGIFLNGFENDSKQYFGSSSPANRFTSLHYVFALIGFIIHQSMQKTTGRLNTIILKVLYI